MVFFRKSCLIGLYFLQISYLQAQIDEKPTRYYEPAYKITHDSMRKYWVDRQATRNFFWTGVSLGIYNPDFVRVSDETNFIPKKKNDVYTFRMRLSYSRSYAGSPTSYIREIAPMYGKVYRNYHFMATVSGGLSFLWGNRWLDKQGNITSPPARGLRQTQSNVPFYTTERFWSIGVPLRTQAFFIIGREFAFGVTLGTTLNVKQLWGDAMFTFLLGIN
ncbi:MAG: hypothetical protein EAZ95_04845 [Bacteroidetes bacterium]|nr:MAG: hypothetical protein EAZ95_04845 [Bacteroidota bacterium]